jgi:hypothetical protein
MTVGIVLTVGLGIVGIVDRSPARPKHPTTSFDVAPSALEPEVASLPQATQPVAAERTPRAMQTIAAERTLDLLCGAQPASLGSVFAGFELGRVVDRLPDAPTRSGLDVKISFATTGRRVDGVDIAVPWDHGYAGCYQFAEQLHQRWGAPSETNEASETWQDVAHEQAATFTQRRRDCTLRFFHVVSPEQWLNRTRSSRVPIWAIGRPVAELEATLGLPPGDDPKTLRWNDASLGRFGDIELTANLQRGRIVGIMVTCRFAELLTPRSKIPVDEILWQRLKALYGAPDFIKGHEDTIEVRWRRVPGISVDKYWGQDTLFLVGILAGEPRGATPRPPNADDGVLVGILFGT